MFNISLLAHMMNALHTLTGVIFSSSCTFNPFGKLKFCPLTKTKLSGWSDLWCLSSSDRAAPNSGSRSPPGRPGVGLHHHCCHYHPAPLPQTASKKQPSGVSQAAGPANGELPLSLVPLKVPSC